MSPRWVMRSATLVRIRLTVAIIPTTPIRWLRPWKRAHNDAHVLVLPARFVTVEEAVRMVDIFLTTTFDGGRHRRRVEKIPVV